MAPKLIEDFGEAGPQEIVALADDNMVYTLARMATDQVSEAFQSIDGAVAAMSPDTGMLVVIDAGTRSASANRRWVQIFCNGGNLIDSARLVSVTLSGSSVCG